MFLGSVEYQRFDLLNAFGVFAAGEIHHRCETKHNFLIVVVVILAHLFVPALLDDRSNVVLTDDDFCQLGGVDVSLEEKLTEEQFDAIEVWVDWIAAFEVDLNFLQNIMTISQLHITPEF